MRGIDTAIIFVYLAVLLGIGLFFARRQKTTASYYVARHSIPSWALGLSIMATIITSITFTAYPGAAYAGDWSLLVPNLMFVVVILLLGTVIVPFFRQSITLSAYSYFRRRFSPGIQIYASIAFAVGHLCKAAFVVYLLALTFQGITNWNLVWIMIGIGGVAVFSAGLGGMEAVVWADVVQGFLLWFGILVTFGILLFLPPGGPHAAIYQAWSHHKISLGSWKFDPTQATVPVLAIYGLFFYLQKYTADQTVVQRYLIAPDDRAAFRGVALGAALCLPCWAAFMLIGSLLWSFYRLTGEHLPSTVVKPDQVFPHFVATHFAPGLAGIFLAAFLGAAISMLASDVNSLSLICVEDLYRNFRPLATDRQCLRAGKCMVVVAGAITVIFAIQLAHIQGTALSAYYTVTAIAAGGLAGLFLLGFLTARANARGAAIGIALSLAITLWAALTSGHGRVFDMGRWNFPWHDYLIGAVGNVALPVSGYLASFLFPGSQAAPATLTLRGWLRSRRAIRPPDS